MTRGRSRICAAFAAGLLGAVAACSDDRPARQAPPPLSGTLRITGSSTMAPLITAMARRYGEIHPGVRIEVLTGGSGRGISDAREGKADIGMASRALTEKERDLHGISIARDGIGFMVHKSNPVDRLSGKQVVEIFSGRLRSWSALGGPKAAIVVVNRPKGRSSLELFMHHFDLRYEDIRADQLLGDNVEVLNFVSNEPRAIAYLSVGEAERIAQAGLPVKLLPLDGVAATTANIRRGEYALSRALVLVTKGPPAGLAKAFIEFCLSAEVAGLIREYDFVAYRD